MLCIVIKHARKKDTPKLRIKNSLHLPYCRTNLRKFSLRFQGPKLFNSLSPEIQNATSFTEFISKLKTYFLV